MGKRKLSYPILILFVVSILLLSTSSFSISYFRFYKEVKVGKKPKFIAANNTSFFVLNIDDATVERIDLKDFRKRTILSLASPVYMKLYGDLLLIVDSSLNEIVLYNVSEDRIENRIYTLPFPIHAVKIANHIAVLSKNGSYFEWFSIKGNRIIQKALPVPAVTLNYKDNNIYIPLFENYNMSTKATISVYGLSIIDLRQDKRCDYVLGRKPLAIIFHNKYAYVDNYSDGTLCKFDLVKKVVIKTVELGEFLFPPTVGNDSIFIPVLSKDAVAVLDLEMRLKRWLKVPSGPVKCLLSKDGKLVYILSCIKPALTIYDTVSFKKIAEIRLKGYPIDMTMTPDEQYVLIVDNDGNDVQIVRKF